MNRPSVRWLLLGVGAASLLLPLLTLLVLRLLDPYLVQQTERQLHAEATLVAEAYREALGARSGRIPGDPRPSARRGQSFLPRDPVIRDLGDLSPPLPNELPQRTAPALPGVAFPNLDRLLRNAQISNLSGVRVLDEAGCAVASSRGQLDLCFWPLPEVRRALAGQDAVAIRERRSDEPTPPLGGLQRRGDLRVFVARPIFDDGRLIGAVWLSRTAESGLEFLVKQRRGLFYGGLLCLVALLLVSASFARWIVRPLSQLERASRTLAQGEDPGPFAAVPAPREVHALALAIDALTQKLRARASYVSDFAAQVSHELKTPLTSIRGALELLRDPQTEMDEPQRQRFLANMDAAAQRTERLVERLLLLARLENPESAPAGPVVPVSRWLAEREAHEHISIGASAEAQVLARQRLELDSVLGNLIDNALRYRRAEPVRVKLEAEGPWLLVSVQDDGPGVRAEDRPQLFRRFFTTERDHGGTGLGLAIVQAIAEGRGGGVDFDSGPEGTTVRVRL